MKPFVIAVVVFVVVAFLLTALLVWFVRHFRG
jgi:hypothetical protein